ncbi:MAG: hypothetical protein QXG03_08400 [Halalkalicoccus sp.]
MSADSDETVVQTTLPPEEYERLREIAEREGWSLKETLRKATREFADRHLTHDADDPLFATPAGTGDVETDARETERRLTDAIRRDGE